ncbi:hypothetical protein E2C01_017589 [Portunus trituberculatus]|uniref:Uncharacterized protein n=1 Tax=Portunus trituberculatus TaxID=210409 RepID=A0A5B7DU77_PORTR|nr:hypothetical protein [Portunus trituberculatus]
MKQEFEALSNEGETFRILRHLSSDTRVLNKQPVVVSYLAMTVRPPILATPAGAAQSQPGRARSDAPSHHYCYTNTDPPDSAALPHLP